MLRISFVIPPLLAARKSSNNNSPKAISTFIDWSLCMLTSAIKRRNWRWERATWRSESRKRQTETSSIWKSTWNIKKQWNSSCDKQQCSFLLLMSATLSQPTSLRSSPLFDCLLMILKFLKELQAIARWLNVKQIWLNMKETYFSILLSSFLSSQSSLLLSSFHPTSSWLRSDQVDSIESWSEEDDPWHLHPGYRDTMTWKDCERSGNRMKFSLKRSRDASQEICVSIDVSPPLWARLPREYGYRWWHSTPPRENTLKSSCFVMRQPFRRSLRNRPATCCQ